MDQEYARPASGAGFGLVNVIFVILGLFAIYYLYRFLYSTANSTATVLVRGQQAANLPPATIPVAPVPYEGGEYSVNTWIYVSSFNTNRNARKHIFEIKGQYFSTLLVTLGAFKNTLTVRTYNNDIEQGFQSGGSGSGSKSGSGSGSGSKPSDTSDTSDTDMDDTWSPTDTGDYTSGSLSASDVNALFKPMAMDDSIAAPLPCDLPEIDLQRWTMITVVLSGRTTDVYMDGKLARSCVGSSYYKVDPTGVKMTIADRGGFDGYIGNTSVANYSMNPSEIYNAYLSGPQGSSMDILSWIVSIFNGAPSL